MDDYVKTLCDAVPDGKLVVIAHPHNIAEEDVEIIHRLGISMLRLCINKKNPKATYDLCRYASGLGLQVSLNVTRASEVGSDDLYKMAEQAELHGANIFCLADSSGNILPHCLEEVMKNLKARTPLTLGFHAHDNLGLAMSNSIAAIKAGATVIDSALFGMGKGAGNLSLEMWLSYLNLVAKTNRYDLALVLHQAQLLETQDFYDIMQRDPMDMILAMHNLNVSYKSGLKEHSSRGIKAVFAAVGSFLDRSVL
ncbi:hypothetical protein [Bartonella rattaustraliani]|uniref:hypothetical protein n=1 Tax=Bartonella rattaustraliani TaxID=481139 RepID=UPI000375ADC6|nr:hypothetical protein [Bartonella rattaustraliani]